MTNAKRICSPLIETKILTQEDDATALTPARATYTNATSEKPGSVAQVQPTSSSEPKSNQGPIRIQILPHQAALSGNDCTKA